MVQFQPQNSVSNTTHDKVINLESLGAIIHQKAVCLMDDGLTHYCSRGRDDGYNHTNIDGRATIDSMFGNSCKDIKRSIINKETNNFIYDVYIHMPFMFPL